MDLHQANCMCRVCTQRQIVIERHFGQRNKRYYRKKQDHHALVHDAWGAKMHQMVETTFRQCHAILLEHSPNFSNSRWNNSRSQFKPFNDEGLKEMISNPAREAYLGPTWKQSKGSSKVIFTEDSIESLHELYTSHKALEEELVSICQQTASLDEKFHSIMKIINKIKIQNRQLIEQDRIDAIVVRTRPYSAAMLPKNAPWGLYFQKFFWRVGAFKEEIELEIKRLDVLNHENSITRFMNIGPDMPRYLAEAMADEMISEQEAAEIFRNGWHRNEVSSEVLAAFLRSKTPVKNNNEQSLILDFQTAQWLHAHHEHDSLILAILRSEMDMEAARELLNSDFRNHPNATNAIVAGNPIETVAMMYGIISQPIESEEETSPSLPLQQVNEDTTSSQKSMEWAREF